MGEAYSLIAVFYVFMVLGTAWGFTRIIFPLVGLAWNSLRVFVLVMLAITPLFSGGWFRLFGYNAFDLAWLPTSASQRQELRHYREENHALNGHWTPHWREQQGLAPLPKDWDGHSEHRWPAVFSLLVPLILFGIYAGANRLYNRRKYGVDSWSAKPDLIRTTPSMDNINMRLNKIIGETLPYIDKWDVRIDQKFYTPPTRPAAQKPDTRFAAALRGLGYKDKDIREVSEMCTEQDLESRVRHALRILTGK